VLQPNLPAIIPRRGAAVFSEEAVVDEKIADAFVTKLPAKAGSLGAGDPRKGNTPLGSLIGTYAAAQHYPV
jgi:acyl-CoA reductase-like NAD-dependent aldehyde dehydrogenase